jgi:hypothetical protein
VVVLVAVVLGYIQQLKAQAELVTHQAHLHLRVITVATAGQNWLEVLTLAVVVVVHLHQVTQQLAELAVKVAMVLPQTSAVHQSLAQAVVAVVTTELVLRLVLVVQAVVVQVD